MDSWESPIIKLGWLGEEPIMFLGMGCLNLLSKIRCVFSFNNCNELLTLLLERRLPNRSLDPVIGARRLPRLEGEAVGAPGVS